MFAKTAVRRFAAGFLAIGGLALLSLAPGAPPRAAEQPVEMLSVPGLAVVPADEGGGFDVDPKYYRRNSHASGLARLAEPSRPQRARFNTVEILERMHEARLERAIPQADDETAYGSGDAVEAMRPTLPKPPPEQF